jgi:hypothetical protein
VPLGEGAGVPRAPDPHLAQRPDQTQRFQVAPGLDARAEEGQHRGLRPGQEPGGHRRHRRRAHLGDQAPVEDGERLAGLGPEQQDGCVRSGEALVMREERHQLGAQRAPAVGRHGPEEAPVLRDRHHDPDRLDDLAPREVGQGVRHDGDQLVHAQEVPDRRLVERHPRSAIIG